MKFLNDKDYNAMKGKADNFDAIVEAIVKNGDNITNEDVNADTIIEAIQQENQTEDHSDMLSQLKAANARVVELESEIKTAKARISELEMELDEAPGAEPAVISAKGEPSAEPLSIDQFANKNIGDTDAILAQAEKEGLI